MIKILKYLDFSFDLYNSNELLLILASLKTLFKSSLIIYLCQSLKQDVVYTIYVFGIKIMLKISSHVKSEINLSSEIETLIGQISVSTVHRVIFSMLFQFQPFRISCIRIIFI